MELILIRHGLPERVAAAAGAADPALTDLGWSQSHRVANWLHEGRVGPRVDALYASTMRRARETSEPAARLLQCDVQLHDGVAEFDRNTSEYIPMEELKRTDYARWKALAAGTLTEGVDISAFSATVVNALEEIIGNHKGQRVAVFCHGGVINVWASHVLGMTPRMFFAPEYTSIHRFMCASTGQRNVLSLNEAAHLHGL